MGEEREPEQELVETRETAWLDAWANSVVSCALLPEMSLKYRQRPLVGTEKNSYREWSLPVTLKTKRWRKRFHKIKKPKSKSIWEPLRQQLRLKWAAEVRTQKEKKKMKLRKMQPKNLTKAELIYLNLDCHVCQLQAGLLKFMNGRRTGILYYRRTIN